MKAVGLFQYLPIEDARSLVDVEVVQPVPDRRDILVSVQAVSVNPLDTKVRAPRDDAETNPRILGWDAAGIVIALGKDVENYMIGDRVYYAGDFMRPGCNSEFHCVDERIVGLMPSTLNFAEAAALPLAGITAWEALFDRMAISETGRDEDKTILIIGGAGGIGSMAIQLAKKIARLKVVATASRAESVAWAKRLGADHVVDHNKPLDDEIRGVSIAQVDYILCLNAMHQHWEAMARAIAPQGRICSIVDSPESVDIGLLKGKSVAFVWEAMFTRSTYDTHDISEQQRLLNSIAERIDRGEIVTTVNRIIEPIDAENLRRAHKWVEHGNTIGKVVVAKWG